LAGWDHRFTQRVEGALPSRLEHQGQALGLIAGYAAPYQPPRDPGPEQHSDVDRPGELVGIDCFYVGRLKGTEGAIWQLTTIDARCRPEFRTSPAVDRYRGARVWTDCTT
jgi:hypothetical protein